MSKLTDSDRIAYGIGEAAEVLGLSRPTIYKLVKEGKLRTVKVGARRLVPRSDLLRLMGEVSS